MPMEGLACQWKEDGACAQVAGLLQQRNLLAANLGRGASLLPVLREPRTCGACFQLSNCALLHKVAAAAALLAMPWTPVLSACWLHAGDQTVRTCLPSMRPCSPSACCVT